IILCLSSLLIGLSTKLTGHAAATVQSRESSQRSEEIRTIAPGSPVDREMSGARRHLYQITLEGGQCLKIIAEQRGADIALALDAPDGKQLASAENNRGGVGVEWLLWQAPAPGNYLIEINSQENSGGSYRLNVETFAPQGDALLAFQSYLEAGRLA